MSTKQSSNNPKKPGSVKASNVTFPFFVKKAGGVMGTAPKSIQKKQSSVPRKVNQTPTKKKATKTKSRSRASSRN